MQEAQRVAVNIAATNALTSLPNCLASLDAQTDRAFSVTVVDNASTDGTVSWLQEHRPDVAMLRNFRTQGFSRAQNQAFAFAKSRWAEDDLSKRYVLILAPDVELAPAALEGLVSAMEADAGLAVVGPKLLTSRVSGVGEDGTRETERTETIRSVGLLMTKSRRVIQRGKGEEDRGIYDAAADVFGISSACALYRASSLLEMQIGEEIFDEDFGTALTDADLAWRMRRQGFRARLVPESIAWQHIGFPERATAESVRNAKWLIWKNDEFMNRLAHAPWIAGACLLDLARTLVSAARIRGCVDAFSGWFKMRAKRSEAQARVVVSGERMRKFFV